MHEHIKAEQRAADTLQPGCWVSGSVFDMCISLMSACLVIPADIRVYSNTILDIL